MLRTLFCNGCRCDDVMEEIRKMDLSRSLLHEIPRTVFYCERTLEQLYLDSNHISELPRQLFNCDELRVLSLMDNDISFIPPAISTLVHLEKLNLCKNSVCDLPENIKLCMSLTFLDLSVNPLDRFPEYIINLTALQELYLNDTYLEYLPANFGKLVNLRLLELRENNLNALPKTMCRLAHLTRLDIGNNEFTELPEVVSSLHNLTELWIDGNRIRRLPPQIAQLRKMIHFEAGNNLIDSLPRDIGYWTRVVEFAVSNNDISAIPTTIGNMKNLVGLKLDDNNMKALPDTIGKLTNLEDLMLSHNLLTHLPSSIGLLRKLRVLTVDKNYLRDIPSELGSCTSVTTLSLRSNRISEVPAEIGHMTNLRVLNLVDNHLKHLPMSLLKLNNLGALWLSNNQSQPLVPLQQERNPEQNQTVLTCFMLPQLKKTGRPEVPTESEFSHKQTPHHRHICFASDAGLPEQRSRLTRAPTPYPKELRAMSKHAKTVQRGLTVLPPSDPGESSRKSATSPIQIKEAKVATTSPSAENKSATATKQRDRHSQAAETGTGIGEAARHDKPLSLDYFYDIDPPQTIDIVAPKVLKCEKQPQIREAKNIQTQTSVLSQSQTAQAATALDVGEHEALQPPPYHIAAAYSRQAQYFNSESGLSPKNSSPPRLHLKRSDLQNGGYPPAKIAHVAGAAYHQIGHVAHFELALKNMIQSFGNLSITEMYDDDRSSPRRFIQDVPEPSQHIVAPTPQRPQQLHSGDNLRTTFVSQNFQFPSGQGIQHRNELENKSQQNVQIGANVKISNAQGSNDDNGGIIGTPVLERFAHSSPLFVSTDERNQSGIGANVKLFNAHGSNASDDNSAKNGTAELPRLAHRSPLLVPTEQSGIGAKVKIFNAHGSNANDDNSTKNGTAELPRLAHRSPLLVPTDQSGIGAKVKIFNVHGSNANDDNSGINGTEELPRLAHRSPLRVPTDERNQSGNGAKAKISNPQGSNDDIEGNIGTSELMRLAHRSHLYVSSTDSNERDESDGNSSVPSTVSESSTTKRGKQQETLRKWMFGNHKNATVMQVTVVCKPGMSIELSTKWGKGIYVDSVFGCEQLQPGDKILECDGLDFSKLSKSEVKQFFRTRLAHSSLGFSMMISRMK